MNKMKHFTLPNKVEICNTNASKMLNFRTKIKQIHLKIYSLSFSFRIFLFRYLYYSILCRVLLINLGRELM